MTEPKETVMLSGDRTMSSDDRTIRIAEFFLGRLARAVSRDFKADCRDQSEAIRFALGLVDSEVIADHDEVYFCFRTSRTPRTRLAIHDAAQAAICVHDGLPTYPIYPRDGTYALAQQICEKILARKGFMNAAVYEVFVETYGGPFCEAEIRAFWAHLGVTTNEQGLFPVDW
jgi:hypothetical protein